MHAVATYARGCSLDARGCSPECYGCRAGRASSSPLGVRRRGGRRRGVCWRLRLRRGRAVVRVVRRARWRRGACARRRCGVVRRGVLRRGGGEAGRDAAREQQPRVDAVGPPARTGGRAIRVAWGRGPAPCIAPLGLQPPDTGLQPCDKGVQPGSTALVAHEMPSAGRRSPSCRLPSASEAPRSHGERRRSSSASAGLSATWLVTITARLYRCDSCLSRAASASIDLARAAYSAPRSTLPYGSSGESSARKTAAIESITMSCARAGGQGRARETAEACAVACRGVRWSRALVCWFGRGVAYSDRTRAEHLALDRLQPAHQQLGLVRLHRDDLLHQVLRRRAKVPVPLAVHVRERV